MLLPVPLQRQHAIAVTLWSVKCRDIDKWSTLHYESGIWDSIAKYRPLESCGQAHTQMGLRLPKTRNGINPNLVHAITSRRSGHIWKVGTFWVSLGWLAQYGSYQPISGHLANMPCWHFLSTCQFELSDCVPFLNNIYSFLVVLFSCKVQTHTDKNSTLCVTRRNQAAL